MRGSSFESSNFVMPCARGSASAAAHSSSSDDGAYLGESCGIVIRLAEGRTVYFAGDTCVFGDMQLIAPLVSSRIV